MKNKKDVLFLCQFFYPEYVSSATLPYDTAIALRKEGFTVEVLCGYPKEYNLLKKVPLKETHEKVNIKRLNYVQFKRNSFVGRIINYFSFTFSVLLRFMKFRNYKSIIVYSNPPILPLIAVWANIFFNSKVIFVSYDVYPEMAYITNTISEDSMISKMMGIVNKRVFKNVNKVVALSNEMKDYLLEHRTNLTEQQIEIIPNWYEDQATLNKEEVINTSMFKDFKKQNKFVVSYFGNMGIAQDLNTIADAIRELKAENDIHFLFAGHGNKVEILKEIVEKEKLENVSILEFLHGQEFQDALNISDVYIVSLAEGLTGLAVPSKTYSYMMAGKPIIAIIGRESDIAKDLINNNAGYAMEVGEVASMVDAIKDLKYNEKKRIKMGENCRRVYLKKYTKSNCTNKYVELVQGILEDEPYV